MQEYNILIELLKFANNAKIEYFLKCILNIGVRANRGEGGTFFVAKIDIITGSH